MRSQTRTSVLLTSALALTLAACSTASTGGQGDPTNGDATPEPEVTAPYDPAVFDETSTTIDNTYFPIVPGWHLVFEGSTNGENGRISRRVEFSVTDLAKSIGDVQTAVVREMDFDDGVLAEAELIFYAQDPEGTVWHLGQYPEEYEDGEIVATPAWITGVEDAVAGILMRADPQPAEESYSQGWGPAVDWTDRAQITAIEPETCVPVDCYQDVVVIEEFNAQEADAFQLKYYAQGVGNVKVGWRGDGDPDQETLELIEARTLSAAEMDELRQSVLELEARAYDLSPDVYGSTDPSTPRE